MKLTDGLRRARAEVLELLGVNRRARRRLDGSAAAILMYHRVLPPSRARALAVEPGMFVTPASFAAQLDWLLASFRVLSLGEIVSRWASGRALPEGACAITFDDGWRDNVEFALPALEARGLPATVFVVTDRVGSDGAFWPDEVARRLGALGPGEARETLRRLGVDLEGASGRTDPTEALLRHLKAASEDARGKLLDGLRASTPEPPPADRELADWDEIARLARGGFAIESHGASHAILTAVGPERARQDLERARTALRERDYGRHGLLAYPSGACDEAVAAAARETGHAAAVTTRRAVARAGDDPLRLPRLGVHEDISRSRAEFLAKVPGQW